MTKDKKTTKKSANKAKSMKSVDKAKPEVQTNAPEDAGKRDFIVMTASGVAAAGAAVAAVPLVQSMSPAADVLALSTVEFDISEIAVGESRKVMWQGKPVVVRRRTADEIAVARAVNVSELPDQELVKDEDRVKAGKDEWLVVVGICTHLGCLPTGNRSGEYDGWFCPCHGSHYDTAGRIRKGPAPKNLEVPPYEFISDSVIKIG